MSRPNRKDDPQEKQDQLPSLENLLERQPNNHRSLYPSVDDDELIIDEEEDRKLPHLSATLPHNTPPPLFGRRANKGQLEDDTGTEELLPLSSISRHTKHSSRSAIIDSVNTDSSSNASETHATAAVRELSMPNQMLLSQHGDNQEDQELLKALRESEQMLQQQQSSTDTARDAAQELHAICRAQYPNRDVLQFAITQCQQEQQKIAATVERLPPGYSDAKMEELLMLNFSLLQAVETGEQKLKSIIDMEPTKTASTASFGALLDRRDAFGLICMLRAQDTELRLQAALALWNFSRNTDQWETAEHERVLHEIRSSGGVHGLLTLFRTKDITYETRVIAALVVANLLGSFVSVKPNLGLKIIECLRFLTTTRTITPNGQEITATECFQTAALGLTVFWINWLEPMLHSDTGMLEMSQITGSGISTSTFRRSSSSGGRSRGRISSIGGDFFDQRQESIEIQELLEMAVSLVVHIAKQSPIPTLRVSGNPTLLIEQICAVEVARPLAVREGILSVLVEWIKRGEKLTQATSALRNLTSIKDRYMAGWIHSQMVNEGALPRIVALTQNPSLTQDVRLSITQIVSSLCGAPHTRAAVVESGCVHFLIDVLYEHSVGVSSQEIIYHACRALVQLAAGAITRASVFVCDDFEQMSFVSPEKRDTLVDDILARGAISSFVSIVTNDSGKLRPVAIEAIRVLSEDISLLRQTRLQLCEAGAAWALGKTIKDDLDRFSHMLQESHDFGGGLEFEEMKELHEALCALANILDPIAECQKSGPLCRQHDYNGGTPSQILIKACIQITESGGLASLLRVATVPFISSNGLIDSRGPRIFLVEEACRSMAFISPLLLSQTVARKGYSRWADDVLAALHLVLKQLVEMENSNSWNELMVDLHLNILQGLSSLARSAPLKVRIIDRILPYLVQAKSVHDISEISNAAGQAFQALEFASDEVAAQVAGNNPNLLADWFCLNRSLLLQSMARAEIKKTIEETWNVPFHDAKSVLIETQQLNGYENFSTSMSIFPFFATDDSLSERSSIVRQYVDIYDGKEAIDQPTAISARGISDEAQENDRGLLSRQVYPLNTSSVETKWILHHHKFMVTKETPGLSHHERHSKHVAKFLRFCIPSQLLLESILPMKRFDPDATFDFRALMMPQRRYFSFRREGQLLSRLCANDGAKSKSDVHWTLAFTNSSFAGEFTESLVQVLYLCPMIRGLSFARNENWLRICESDRENKSDDGGGLLANVAGSLPPWVSHLTFEGILNDRDLKTLVAILEALGKLSPAQVLVGEKSSEPEPQRQGNFSFFGIRNCPHLPVDTWKSLFLLLGKTSRVLVGPSAATLSCLKSLDLSGNLLGDEACAIVLEIVYDRNSCCMLEELDLSGNRISQGIHVTKVFSTYAQNRRQQVLSASRRSRLWRSTLRVLRLASNGLQSGKAWLEIISSLKHNQLELRVLDLSSNMLSIDDSEEDLLYILVSSLLNNTTLCQLNLGHNKFSHATIDETIKLLRSTENQCQLGFLDFNGNDPILTDTQLLNLQSLHYKSRSTILSHYFTRETGSDGSSITESDSQRFTESASADSTSRSPDDIDRFNEHIADNKITVLFSAPLVYTDTANVLRPFAKLDFNMERELLWQCLKEAGRDIDLSFDNATHNRLLATMAKRCSCLHYSGHGHKHYLPFENGRGGPHWLEVQRIKDLIASKEGVVPFRFVFVSACHSGLAGETFASAGVPHVVCCQQEFELKDAAALAFTRQFYLALAVGHTVQESFDQGCRAVRATPHLRDADIEMDKFCLLPRDGNHNVPIFDAPPIPEWPRPTPDTYSLQKRKNSRNLSGTKASELSVRNMMQEDPSPSPPQFFMGREVDLYYVLNHVLEKRLVSVVGESGLGRSSLVCALCHYINERASSITDIEQIFYVKAKRSRSQNVVRVLVQKLTQKLLDHGKAVPSRLDDDFESSVDAICKSLKYDKVLIVFDRMEIIQDADDANEFPLLLSSLLRETRNVRVLLTARKPLGIPSIGGQVEQDYPLGPLNFGNTVRLFANLCPYLHTPADRKKLFERLATDPGEIELLPTDPDLSDSTKWVFDMLGKGIPAWIEKESYSMTKEDYMGLMSGEHRRM